MTSLIVSLSNWRLPPSPIWGWLLKLNYNFAWWSGTFTKTPTFTILTRRHAGSWRCGIVVWASGFLQRFLGLILTERFDHSIYSVSWQRHDAVFWNWDRWGFYRSLYLCFHMAVGCGQNYRKIILAKCISPRTRIAPLIINDSEDKFQHFNRPASKLSRWAFWVRSQHRQGT